MEPVPAAGRSENGSGDGDDAMASLSGRRLAQTVAIVTVLVVAIYLFLPKLVGLQTAIGKLGDADPIWVVIALVLGVAMFGTYIALFRGVVGGDVLPLSWREAYEINMAGLAATRLFSAGGAGGIALTYWALRKAGMPPRQSACRMIAFLVLQYMFYPLALIVCGILLRTGVAPGRSDVSLTIIPAAIAAVVLALAILVALIPQDFERRMARYAPGTRRGELAGRLAKVPASIAAGVRTAFDLFSHPKRGGLAIIGAVGFWATQIAILWAAFEAFGVNVDLAVLIQAFFLGMVANLIPFAPGGVGAVDAGLIGAFVLFGLPESTVFAAVLLYRLVAFWLPIPVGLLAFIQLRHTVDGWQHEGLPADRVPGAETVSATA